MDLENKIAFTRIRSLVGDYCLTPVGTGHLEKMHFSTVWKEIVRWQDETEEFRQILLFDPDFPLRAHADLRQELEYLKIAGSRIQPESLCELKATMENIQAVLLFFRVESEKPENRYPRLTACCDGTTISNDLVRAMAAIVDDKGGIRDNASQELLQIRQQIMRTER